MNLPQAIRHARKELGLTQADLAELSGVQRKQISTLERGGNVTLKTLAKVLAHLPNLTTFNFETVAVSVKRTPHDDCRRTGLARALLSAALQALADP